MDPTWLLIKVVGHKRCNNWLHRFCFTPLGMTYGFRWVNRHVCSVWSILILKVGRLSYHTSKGFYLLTYLFEEKNTANCLPRKQNYKTSCNPHPFLRSEAQIWRLYFWGRISSFSPFSAIPLSCHCGRHPIFSVLMNVNLAPSFYPEITRCCIICERYVGLRYLYYKPQLDLMASYRSLIKSLNQCRSRSTIN